MTELYNRKIRIENCKCPDNLPIGSSIIIKDAQTEERITNIVSVDIHLSPMGLNMAELTYYEIDANKNLIIKNDEPIEHVAVAKDPEIKLTTFARTIGHPQAIMNIAQKALKDINGATESDWPGILANALDDIISRCEACLPEQGTVGRD